MAPQSSLPVGVATTVVSDHGTIQWSAGETTQQMTNSASPGNMVSQFGGASYTDSTATNQFAIGGQMSSTTSHSTEMFTSAPPFSHGDKQVPPTNENFNLQASAHGSEQTSSNIPSVSEASLNFVSHSTTATGEHSTGMFSMAHPVSSSFPTSLGPMQSQSTSGASQTMPFQPPTQPSTQEKKLSSEKEISKGILSTMCHF